jgi:glucose/mannose-6-phosphate isomerase
MNEVNLDDARIYRQTDPGDMLTYIHDVPQLYRRAWQMAIEFRLPPDYSEVDKVVVLGMGGSAIGGDLAGSLVLGESRVPVLVCRDYNLPRFVDSRSLVIASSYSGNTEETLSTFEQAHQTGAKRLVISTGGRLKTMAVQENIPLFSFDYKTQPRASLPFSFLAILGVLQNLGFIPDKSQDVAETVSVLEKLAARINENSPAVENLAKQTAQQLHGRLGVIYGAGIVSEAAHRWKTQLNENGKVWAFYEVFPELNHNSVVGYRFPSEIVAKIIVVFLRSSLLNKRVLLRYDVTQQLLQQAGVAYRIIDGDGDSPLSQVASLVLIGDYVSYYVALLHNIDPTPVQAIDYLKDQLAKR